MAPKSWLSVCESTASLGAAARSSGSASRRSWGGEGGSGGDWVERRFSRPDGGLAAEELWLLFPVAGVVPADALGHVLRLLSPTVFFSGKATEPGLEEICGLHAVAGSRRAVAKWTSSASAGFQKQKQEHYKCRNIIFSL